MGKQLDTAASEFAKHMDARIASYFTSCVHCGMCAEACHFYQETGDPRYTPIYKLEPMRKIWKEQYTFWGKFSVKMGWSKPWSVYPAASTPPSPPSLPLRLWERSK